MITSKLTSKAQTTIPHAVRKALGLRAGDELVYALQDGCVVLTRAEQRADLDEPFAAFLEWSSPEDAKAYGEL